MTFPVEAEPVGASRWAVVVKDAGDDPDCTDGAHMTAVVASLGGPGRAGRRPARLAGDGIGTITMPGLGLDVGRPAINPVPRRMILAAVGEVTDRPLVVDVLGARRRGHGGQDVQRPPRHRRRHLDPRHHRRRQAVLDRRLPGVGRAAGRRGRRPGPAHLVVLATGSRSETGRPARCCPTCAEVCFVEVGDFTGIALRRAAAAGIERVVFVGMAGKIAKLAAGVMMTHFHRSKVDTELLAEVAREAGAPARWSQAATETATARHFFEVCVAARRARAPGGAVPPGGRQLPGPRRRRPRRRGPLVDFAGEHEIARG